MAKLNIIIPIHKDNSKLNQVFESLNDQDFKDFKVIIVNDGAFVELDEKLKDLSKGFKFEFMIHTLIEKAGASVARNVGYYQDMTSEYLLFLDSDTVLLPGILTNMVLILDKHKDVDFVYGDYEFDNGTQYISRPFNPYILKTFNYICTMSMMRTKAFLEFNKDLSYFQDWDLFYRMAKNKSKGYYLKEVLFSTLTPDSNSISGIKLPISEKSKKFRDVNKIKDKKIVVTTLGCPLQAEQRAEMLEADFAGTNIGYRSGIYPSNLRFDNWTHTYIMGFFNENLDSVYNHLNVVVGRPIIHFIGTDVHHLLTRHNMYEIEEIKQALINKRAILLSNSERIQNELKNLGIETQLVYTPLYKPELYKPCNLPDVFTVAIYYSDSSNMNYFNTQDPTNINGESNVYMLWEIAKSLPHINFKFFGGRAKFSTQNVEFCGNIPLKDMPEFIKSCSCNLRSTVHDSLPQLPLQFLLTGRRVITSSNFNVGDLGLSFNNINNYEKNKNEVINKILQAKEAGGLTSEEINKVNEIVYQTMEVKNYKKIIYDLMKRK